MVIHSLRVLFLTRYPSEGASSRYRVFQYLPYLEALGIRCTAQSFMNERMYRLSLSEGHFFEKCVALVSAVVRRLIVLRRWREYDAIYLQREMFPIGPPLIERWLKRRGATILFDYDDALFINKPNRYNPFAALLRSPGKTEELFRLVDCTVAGNDWLRDCAIAEGGRSVTVEVAEDTSRIPMHATHSTNRSVTVGWLGSPSTVKYLRLIEGPLQRLAQRYPEVRWQLMGGGDFHMDGVPWQSQRWSLDGELLALATFDIGLMPLPNERWALGKSGGKARTYMAAGVVPVVADVGYNRQLIDHERTGFLCSTDSDWEYWIEALINDAELRERVAVQARRDVEQRFSLAGQASKLSELLHQFCLGTETSK